MRLCALALLASVAGLPAQSRPASVPRELVPGIPVSGELDGDGPKFVVGSYVRGRQTDLTTPGVEWRFRAPADGTYTITCSSAEFDAGLIVLDEAARTRRFVDEGGLGVDARTSVSARADAEFRIIVCDPDGEGGHFTLEAISGQVPQPTGDAALRRRVEGLRAALSHCRATFAADDPRIASRACDLARVLPASGAFDEAERLYREALAARIARYGDGHMIVALTRSNLGSLLVQTGRLAEARTCIESALRTYQSDDRLGPALATGALANLAALDRVEGRYEQALDRYRSVLADARSRSGQPDELYVAKCRNNCASALLDCGRFAEARAEFAEVVKVRERLLGPKDLETITSWNNLADAGMRLGEFEQARTLFERAVTAAEGTRFADHPVLARVLSNLASLCSRQGRPRDAEPHLERALAILEKNFGVDHPDRVQPLCTLASLALARSQPELAEPRLAEALRLLKRTSAEHPQIGVVQVLSARCQLARGDTEAAAASASAATRLFERVYGDEGHIDLANALVARSDVALARGEVAEAHGCATRALGLLRRWLGEDHPATSVAYAKLGHLAALRGEDRDAVQLLLKSLASRPAALERQVPTLSEGDRVAWVKSQRAVLDELLALTARPGAEVAPEVVHAQVTRWKGLVANGLLRGRNAFRDREAGLGGEGRRARDELASVLTELARVGADYGSRSAAQRRATLALLSARKANLERELASAVAKPVEDEAHSRASVPLAGGDVLVDWIVYEADKEARLCAFVLGGTRAPRRYELGPVAPITAAIDAHRQLLRRVIVPSRDGSAEAVLTGVAAKVRALVLDPFQEEWRRASRLWLVPDGPLVLLAFAALPSTRGSGFLVEDHELTLLATCSEPPVPEGSSSRPAAVTALLVGGVTYGAPRFPELPGTETEVATLRELWLRGHPKDPVAILRGSAATETEVRRALPGISYVHFATHGFCEDPAAGEPDLGLLGIRSGIALAQGAGGDDGLLTAEELSWCDLSACRLVTLSACETGLGSVQNGQGLAGLRRSLRIAGARATLTTLWPVEDRAAQDLMTRVYAWIWVRGATPSRALRQAQLEVLAERRKATPGQDVPGGWAGFVLESR